MKLYLAQHGEACGREINSNRHLTDQGLEDIQQVAEFLKRAGIRVHGVLHSGRLRAKQTAELLANAIAPGITVEISGLINPNDSPKTFDWQRSSWSRDMLVVGHEPFLSRLVSHLLLKNENLSVTDFQPGTVVCLEHLDNGQWNINWVIRPELLRNLALVDSSEETDNKLDKTIKIRSKQSRKRLEHIFSHIFNAGHG